MAASETAGVVAKANWNSAAGASSASPLALVNENGASTGATVSWHSDAGWSLPITDAAGSIRMMRGYLDNAGTNPITVTVANLPASSSGYDVYVYTDGDNAGTPRTAGYQISGAGITTTTVSATDAANAVFSGSFTQANNSAGNYVKFTINATGFTLTATPGTSTDAFVRAPVNGIQIVPFTGNSGNQLPSSWSSVIPLPVNPIGVANLPNGKLLMWSAFDTFSFETDIGNNPGQTFTAIFDPATDTATERVVTNTGADFFCPGTTNLPDGRVLINGGSSSPRTSIYDFASNSWTASGLMNVPRGYEGNTLLSNGNVLTFGGSWSGGTTTDKKGEVWSNGSWTLLSGLPSANVIGPDPQGVYRGDNHLWLFATSNGKVFHAGPSSQMNWIDTNGAGSIQSAGTRGSDAFSVNGAAAMYDVGMILKAGGAPAYQQSTGTTFATNSAYVINIKGGFATTPIVTPIAPMAYRRAFVSNVVLPNGKVVLVGGQSIPQPFTDTSAILVPEIWDPTTQAFSPLAPMATPRTYHSTAILMADGRVFVGGGGQCGSGCAQNHLNAEILPPPYLLNADGTAATRPVIQSAPTTALLGSQITVVTGSPVTSFALMRLSSITHDVNNDQRRIPLTPASTGTNTYSLTLPSDPGIVLPGYYMLFALNAQGVPSVSTTILIH